MDQPITSPILAKKRIAEAVGDMRDQLALSQTALARKLGCSPGTVGMYESRQRVPNEDFLRKLVKLCGREDELDELLDVRRIAKRREPEWRGIDEGAFLLGFDEFVSLEQAAERIDCYETRMIPGLLQTPDYAWSALNSGSSTAGSSARFKIRMRRQELLSRENPARLWVILDEQALNRPIGSPEIMRAQFDYLLSLPERYEGRVRLQVYPVSAPPSTSPFTMLRFASPHDAGVVAVETRIRTIFFHRPAEINQFVYELDHLREIALPSDQSAELIKRRRREIGDAQGIR